MIIDTLRRILNFFKKVNTYKHSDESECENCDTYMETHNTDKTNVTQANIQDTIINYLMIAH